MKAKNVDKMCMNLPFAVDWVKYKGATYFAQINYQSTQKAGKPMIDLHYCATKALNGIVEKTVQWDKSKFSPSKLAKSWKP